jgi:alpha-galactosidase
MHMTSSSTVHDHHAWAPTPPMGWNSWDCFATTVTEAQVKEQAAFMAEHLAVHGWQYVVVDIQWYEPDARDHSYREDACLVMDAHGRLQPAVNRFPSSADGSGFKALADHVHGLGLKFGIHLLRGIPRQAVKRNLPILGTRFRAQDIADQLHVCPWNPDMYGVDMSRPGAQDYYDSVFALIAAWGVDYVKVDDLSRPYVQNQPEVEAIRSAIDKTGRRIVLSLSPGATDLRAAAHVREVANLWRISDDFWDRWLALKEQFWRLSQWNPHRQTGAWPDADMLALGTLVLGQRTTRFTPDEQITLITLWSIARSPLMHGGDLTKTDDFTLSLLTNDEVLAVNQRSERNRPLFDRDGLIAWTAVEPSTGDAYLALFNARDRVPLTAQNASQIASGSSAIDVDVTGAHQLFLVAEADSDRDGFPRVEWRAPHLVMAGGSELPLEGLGWTRADAQWDSAKQGEQGLVAQASAVVEYAVPAGATRFRTSTLVADPDAHVRFLVVVGTRANEDLGPGLPVEVSLGELGIDGPARPRDLWTHESLGEIEGSFAPVVPYHGARLYRLSRSGGPSGQRAALPGRGFGGA